MPIGDMLLESSGSHARSHGDRADRAEHHEQHEQQQASHGEEPTRPSPLERSTPMHPTVPSMAAASLFVPPPMRAMLDTPHARVELEPEDGSLGTLTVLRGCEVGRAYALDGDDAVIGRVPACGIWIDDASVSRRHARVERRGGARYVLEDLGSTNGTFVGERRLARGEAVPLVSGARVQVGPTALLRFTLVDPRDEIVLTDLFKAATRDALCGAYNRRYFEERLEIEIARARRAHLPLSLLMLDLDGLKSINDAYGHLAGDAMLRAVAAELAAHVRTADVLARWGGDEFVLIAPAAEHREAAHLADRLRKNIAALAVGAPGAELRVTLSVGLACLDEIGDVSSAGADLVARADGRLYGAKRAGKNCVIAAG